MSASTTNAKDTSLNWKVFITPGILIRTNTPAPNTKETFWHPISSTLIYGKHDAVLVDTFLTVEQSNNLVNWVAASGKNLTTIYITHGHGFGIGALLDRFPNAKAVATPGTVRVMRRWPYLSWNGWFPGQIPNNPVIAEELEGDAIDLEGNELRVVELGHDVSVRPVDRISCRGGRSLQRHPTVAGRCPNYTETQ